MEWIFPSYPIVALGETARVNDRKSEHIIVKKKERKREKVWHPEESISIWRRCEKRDRLLSLSFSFPLFLFCTSCMMVEQLWWDFFLLWHSSIEFLRVLIRETRVAARHEEEKDKIEREKKKIRFSSWENWLSHRKKREKMLTRTENRFLFSSMFLLL